MLCCNAEQDRTHLETAMEPVFLGELLAIQSMASFSLRNNSCDAMGKCAFGLKMLASFILGLMPLNTAWLTASIKII